jgi:hypothetical protein
MSASRGPYTFTERRRNMVIRNKLTLEEKYVISDYWVERPKQKGWDMITKHYPQIDKRLYNAVSYCEALIIFYDYDYVKTLDVVDRCCNNWSVNKYDVLMSIEWRAKIAKKIGDYYAPDIERLNHVIDRYREEKEKLRIKDIELKEQKSEFLGSALVIMDELAIERKNVADAMYPDILDKIYASPIDIIFTSGRTHSALELHYNTIGELVVENCEKLKSIGIHHTIVNYIKTRLKTSGLYFVSDLSVESWMLVAKGCGNCWRVRNNVRFFDTKKFYWDIVNRELNSSEHCKKDNCDWSLWEESHHSRSSFFKEITDKFLKCAGVREKMSMVQDLSNKCYDIWENIQRCKV